MLRVRSGTATKLLLLSNYPPSASYSRCIREPNAYVSSLVAVGRLIEVCLIDRYRDFAGSGIGARLHLANQMQWLHWRARGGPDLRQLLPVRQLAWLRGNTVQQRFLSVGLFSLRRQRIGQ